MSGEGRTGPLLGAIEAGGTKFVLAVGNGDGMIHARETIATTSPDETLEKAARWLAARGPLAALGIGSFGPVELDRRRAKWGHVTETPKPGWSGCDLAGFFKKRFDVPIGFDTDVNAAGLGEYELGSGRSKASLVYLTVGTGIGGGLIIRGEPVHGAGHPEMGHFYPRRDEQGADFAGICPFHGDCLEGLASGPAILARWGKALSQLPPDHEAHELVAGYLSQLCHSLFTATAAHTILIGGGVMNTPRLIERIRRKTTMLGACYLPGRDRHTIEAPGLGQDAGIIGALILARRVL